MRHQNKISKLGRTSAHRKATMSAMSNALITHKRITTTLAKAKALRTYVEPILNRAKNDTTHNRRQVFRHLQDKSTVTELFAEIAGKIADRPGGYTRVIKLGQRAGDSAEMAVIELVDYNDSGSSDTGGGGKKRTRRGRAGSGAGRKAATAVAADAETSEDAVDAAEDAVDAAAEDAVDAAEDAVDAAAEDADAAGVDTAVEAEPKAKSGQAADSDAKASDPVSDDDK
jgi:large subunit ribosomal protein L17